jgi:hypothetical protein
LSDEATNALKLLREAVQAAGKTRRFIVTKVKAESAGYSRKDGGAPDAK